MRVLLWDTETSMLLAGCFGLYDQTIQYENVIQDWFMMSSSWKWLGEEGVETVTVLDDPKRFRERADDDYHVVRRTHQAIQRADVLVAHNLKGFDWPKFMARVIYHKLPPLAKPFLVDTLAQVRRFKFTSNRLDDLCKLLDLERKQKLSPGLWIRATRGDRKAIKEIASYNAQDIPPLEELYLTLRPYMHDHPSHALFSQAKCCPRCGGTDFKRDGFRYLSTGVFQGFKCNDCRHPFRGKHAVKRTDHR